MKPAKKDPWNGCIKEIEAHRDKCALIWWECHASNFALKIIRKHMPKPVKPAKRGKTK